MRYFAVALLFTALPLASRAQENAGQDPRVKSIAPFVDEQTVVVVRVDLKRLDPETLVKRLSELGKMPESELADAKRKLREVRKGLRGAGASDIYFLVSLANTLPEPLVVVVPLPEGADSMDVIETLRPMMTGPSVEFRKIGAAVVCGARGSLERMQKPQAVEMPELRKGFAATGNAVVEVVVLMPPALRRSLEETMPKLPAAIGGAPVKVLTRGFSWAAVGVDVDPKLTVRMNVQTDDPAAAKNLEKLMRNVIQAVGKDEKLGPPGLGEILQTLLPKVEGDRLVLNLGEKELSRTLVPMAAEMAKSSRRAQSINNFKQIALAMHGFHDVNKTFPPQAICDKKGRALLSWRVHILPYIDQAELYERFHLDEPWDSEHNKKLIERIPPTYRLPLSKAGAGKTTCLVPVGKDTIFPPGCEGVHIKDVTDGLSNTILVVEADDKFAVEWTKPEDLPIDPKEPLRGLAGTDRGWFLVDFADGSVHVVPRTINAATLRALFTRNGGESIDRIP